MCAWQALLADGPSELGFMSASIILLFSIVRISVSLLTALVAVSVYKLFKGGVMESAWPIFAFAAVFQALAGLGEIVDNLAGYEFAGELIERLSDILSVVMFLWFILSLKSAWRRAEKS